MESKLILQFNFSLNLSFICPLKASLQNLFTHQDNKFWFEEIDVSGKAKSFLLVSRKFSNLQRPLSEEVLEEKLLFKSRINDLF